MKVDVASLWYRKSLHPLVILLLPFSWLFAACVSVRRLLYRMGIFKTERFKVPVIVVGNIVVGGTGKTPFVIWLVNFLRENGFKPGIVSRGVGGKTQRHPVQVSRNDAASQVGDEALLLMQRADCPVVICRDRAKAVQTLIRHHECDIIISDDGLQHYRMGRDIEIVMVDGKRQFGNQQLLPAGPLREKLSRLNEADFVVTQDGDDENTCSMKLKPLEFVSVINPEQTLSFADFPRNKSHAVAGIGHPERFFAVLRAAGFDIIPHRFSDHHLYLPHDLDYADSLTILMTEKDAVKCEAFANDRYWYLRVAAVMPDSFAQALLNKIREKTHEDVIKCANDIVYGMQHDDQRC